MTLLINQHVGGDWGQGTLRIEVPACLSGDPTGAIHNALVGTTHRAGQGLEQNALAAYSRYRRIATGFRLATTVLTNTVASSVWNTHPLFMLREFDTRPHVIAAARAPYLHFFGRRGWVRTKTVQHPGTTGLHALTPLLAQEGDRFQADLVAALTEVLDA